MRAIILSLLAGCTYTEAEVNAIRDSYEDQIADLQYQMKIDSIEDSYDSQIARLRDFQRMDSETIASCRAELDKLKPKEKVKENNPVEICCQPTWGEVYFNGR